jgi:hypothetical protein
MNIQILFDRWRLFLALCGEREREGEGASIDVEG